MAVRIRPKPGDWLESQKNLDRCVDSIYKIKNVNRDYDIPDLAGYSKDRSTIYIDKDMPEGFKSRSGVYFKTDKYLCIHEFVEDSCQENGMHYPDSHQLALAAEENSVRLDGLPVEEYNSFMFAQIRKAAAKRGDLDLPEDLDVEPYEAENQMEMLRQRGYSK